MTEESRRRVTDAFGAPPFNVYAATETAGVASDCAEHRMHLYEDLVVVESVDDENRAVPPGTFGAKLLVTVLFSRTQPLIRYELNDSVRLTTDTCPSGLPFAMLENVQGRVEDTLRLPAASGDRVAVPPLVFNRVMDILPVSGWQIVQAADDSLAVLLSGARDGLVEAAVAESLKRALTAQGVHAPSVQVQRVAVIPKTTSGKTPLIKAYRL
jgi:phenylacetate-coenzyme A ligase PaaK-like adenylate-forming protein